MTQQSEDRLDRIESNLANTGRTLDRLAELLNRSYHQANERLDRIEELVARNAQQIQRNAQQIQFLREMTQGHISQPAPPAHSD